MNIFITGCSGQLENEMQMLQKDYSECHWFNTDVSEPDTAGSDAINRFVGEHEIDGIVNCVTYAAMDKAESNKRLVAALSAEASIYPVAAMAKRDGWMVQVSTGYVFDGTQHMSYTETDTPCPNSVYDAIKLAGEVAMAKICPKHVTIRMAWLYPIFGNNFIEAMLRLGQGKQQSGIIFDQIGTPTYVHDLAPAIMAIINKGIVPGIYHFSNGGITSWYSFTKAVHHITGITTCHVKPLHTAEYPTSTHRPAYSVLDKTKIKETFGIEIPYWEESLTRCMHTK